MTLAQIVAEFERLVAELARARLTAFPDSRTARLAAGRAVRRAVYGAGSAGGG